MMKTKYLFIYICLVLLTAPFGVVKGEKTYNGLTTFFNGLKKSQDNSMSTYTDITALRQAIGFIESNIFEYPELQEKCDNIINSLNGTNDSVCRVFIENVGIIANKLRNEIEVEDPITPIDPDHPKDAIKELKNEITSISQKIAEIEKNGDNKEDENGFDKDVIYILALIILFLMILVLYFKNRKLNRGLKDKVSKNALDSNIGIINEKFAQLNQQQMINHPVEKKHVSGIKTIPPTPAPQVVTQPATPTPAPQTNNETILYVTVDATPNVNDKLWKETSERTDQHLYEIHLDNPNSTTGELRICPNLKPEFEKYFISERQSFFKICEIRSNGVTSPTRVELKKSGYVVKNGNEWRVTVQPIVELK